VAITYVGVGTAATSAGGTTGSVTPTLPSGLQANDLMIIIVTGRGNHSFATPTGWTQKFQEQLYPTDNLHKLAIFYKFYVAGDGNPVVSWTGGGTNQTVIAQVFAFRGVDATNPIPDLGPNSGNASAQNIGPITGFTPTGAGNDGCVTVIGHKADDWTSVATLTGDGLTWNEIAEPDTTSGNDAGQVYDYALYSGSPPTITNKTFTVTGGAANTGAGKMFSLKQQITTTRTLQQDAGLKAAGQTQTITQDAGLKAAGQIQTISQDAWIKTGVITTTQTIDQNAQLKSTESKTIPQNAALKAVGQIQTVPQNAGIKAAGQIQTVPQNAYVKAAGQIQTIPQNATLKETSTKTFEQNAFLIEITSRTLLQDAMLKETSAKTLSQEATLKTTLSQTIDQNAFLKAIETHDLLQDAGIKGSVEQALSQDAWIRLPYITSTQTLSQDAAIKEAVPHEVPRVRRRFRWLRPVEYEYSVELPLIGWVANRYEVTFPITGAVASRYEETLMLQGQAANRFELTVSLTGAVSKQYEKLLELSGVARRSYETAVKLFANVARRYEVSLSLKGHVRKSYSAQFELTGRVRDAVEQFLLYKAILDLIENDEDQ